VVPCLRFASTKPRFGRYAYTSIGAWEHGYPWVPTDQGPRGPSSGLDLPEAPPICKWAWRPYLQPRRPWKTPGDLNQIPEDPLGALRVWPRHSAAEPRHCVAIPDTVQVSRSPVRTGRHHSATLCCQLPSSSLVEPLQRAWEQSWKVYGRRPSARTGRRRGTDYAGHVFSTIPDTMRPSPSLWRLVLTRQRHADTCAASSWTFPHEWGPRTSMNTPSIGVRMMTRRRHWSKLPLEAIPLQAQESPRHPQKPEFAINLRQAQGFARTTVTPAYCSPVHRHCIFHCVTCL
jgi:hypothetical protein